MDRRNFVAATALTALAAKELALPAPAAAQATAPAPHLTWQLWSRHLQWVGTQAQQVADPYGTGVKVGQACLMSGYSAVDLTVRNDGHVHPSNVATHLPAMLAGIRSTGCLCDYIGVNFACPTNPADTNWIASQFVHEILSVASAHGIRRYRFNNAGGPSYAANTYGREMTAQLDGLRLNFRRLAQINAQYGGLTGCLHTHSSNNLAIAVWDVMYALQGIDPNLIGLNFAIGHVVSQGPFNLWQVAQRYARDYLKGTALHDVQFNRNATTGALGTTIVPAGSGNVNWQTFFRNLLAENYAGSAEAQIEFSVTGANGTAVSLNSAYFADNAQFASGNLTPALMTSTMKAEVDYYKTQALAAGWTAAQMT